MKSIFTRFNLIVGPAALLLLSLCVFQPPDLTALANTTDATAVQGTQSLVFHLGGKPLAIVRERTLKQGDPERPIILGQIPNTSASRPKANGPHPELIIKQFLFPPTNDQALRVHVANKGKAASGAVTIYLGTGETNNVADRTRTHVKVFSPLAAGAAVWLVIDASSILPNKVSLQSTNFKLNVYSTEVFAASGKTEVRHAQLEFTAATPTSAQRRRIIEGYSAEFYGGSRIESGNKEKLKSKAAQPEESRDSFYGTGVYKSTDAGGNTNSQGDHHPTETITFTYGGLYSAQRANSVEVFVYTPDRQKFLANPVSALRRQGSPVPLQAEPHWRALTVALQRLANPRLPKPAGASRSRGVETLTYQIDLHNSPGVVLTILGDWNGDDTTTGARRFEPKKFFADPVATLRALGVKVPAADERDWRQLAAALKELQHVYSTIRVKRNAEGGH
ncbi:MAG: hypothetical protein ND895_16430 [Pyrinomonadaceae bacterium]|nr:hypothetical protein [Pyrinomonadaceae bacterium]